MAVRKVRDLPTKDDPVEILRYGFVVYPEFRSVLYHRMRSGSFVVRQLRKVLVGLFRGANDCVIDCPKVGPGLVIIHGYGTILLAREIGSNLTVYHGVTLGKAKPDSGWPTVGDNVYIGHRASVMGDIRVGNGATVGSGAVVLADVPAGYIAVGVPATMRAAKRKVSG